jgi:tight adherence protein B
MTGPVLAAVALAAAVLVLPSSPRRRLARADRSRKRLPPRAAGWVTVCALAVGAVLLPLTTVLAASVLVATLALRFRRRRCSDRGSGESRELETAIDVLVGELRIGAHPAAAFAVAAHETAGPVAGVAAGLRGVGETSVLQSHWERLAVCWQLAADHGLAMSALMQAAQRDIAERQRFSGQVRSAMAGARATAAILASLPLFSVVMGQLIGARPMAFLLGGQLGGCLLVVGLTLVCGGLLWSDRITDQAIA